jgi:hypothetical protein
MTGRLAAAERPYPANRAFVEAVNRHGGDAELLLLPDAGLHGNTHFPFADLNNEKVADLLSAFGIPASCSPG